MKRPTKSDLMKRLPRMILPQLMWQPLIITAVVIGSLFLMTWLVRDVLSVEKTYIGTSLETLGILAILAITFIIINIFRYRARAREVRTLSTSIRKVAAGDYTAKIPITKTNTAISHVYEDFNRMCDELDSLKIMKNDFINSYSHELKTPIASINGFAELLLQKDLPEKEKREYLEIIAQESSRLSRLATNTMLLSKLSSQQIITDPEEYDLGEQLKQCSILLSHSWLEKDIEFSGDFPEILYYGNKELMQHVWINILGNAVKHTPAGGEISVSLKETRNEIIARIEDTGEGMNSETIEHLFDPYYQGDPSRNDPGLGLGLSIAHRIVELCKGRIEVRSTENVGSEFTVILPKTKMER